MNIDNIFKNMQEKHYYESLDLEVSESIYEIINEYLNRITYIQYDYANIINKTLHKIIIIIDNKYKVEYSAVEKSKLKFKLVKGDYKYKYFRLAPDQFLKIDDNTIIYNNNLCYYKHIFKDIYCIITLLDNVLVANFLNYEKINKDIIKVNNKYYKYINYKIPIFKQINVLRYKNYIICDKNKITKK